MKKLIAVTRKRLSSCQLKLAELEARYIELMRLIADLERQGIDDATLYWRPGGAGDSDYLYIHFRARDGNPRRRLYVGNDPLRVTAATARVERFDLWAAHHLELLVVNEAITAIYERLSGF